jgi:hypothetical protein
VEWFWSDALNKGASPDYIRVDLGDDKPIDGQDAHASAIVRAKATAVESVDYWSRFSALVYNLQYAVYLARCRLMRRVGLPQGAQRPLDPSAKELAGFKKPQSLEAHLRSRDTPEDVLVLEHLPLPGHESGKLQRLRDGGSEVGSSILHRLVHPTLDLSQQDAHSRAEFERIGMVLWKDKEWRPTLDMTVAECADIRPS